MVMSSFGVLKCCAISNKPIIDYYSFEHDNTTERTQQSMLINYAFPPFELLQKDFSFQ